MQLSKSYSQITLYTTYYMTVLSHIMDTKSSSFSPITPAPLTSMEKSHEMTAYSMYIQTVLACEEPIYHINRETVLSIQVVM